VFQITGLQKVLVFDFGGGTCDVSILEMEDKKYTVLASSGDNQLGGEDFDDCLMDHLIDNFESKYPRKLEATDKRRLRRQCERAKREVSVHFEYEVVVERVGGTNTDLKETVTRPMFNKLTKHLCSRVLEPVEQCLKQAKLQPEDIDKVVLVGGSSRLSAVQDVLRKYFHGKKLHDRTNPDEAIAYGAAIQATISSGKYGDNPPCIVDITPFSLGIEEVGNKFKIVTPKNTQLPSTHTAVFRTAFDLRTAVKFTVYQGENTTEADKNTLLGEFKLYDIRLAPAGQVKFDVTFSIDEDGILTVTAVEQGTQNMGKIKIDRYVK
jgi:molecular chaperone DnaK (HSP70)